MFRFRNNATHKLLYSMSRSAFRQNRLLSTSPINDNTRRKLGYWFLGVGGLVAGTVTIGGITRLTRSGLSMTSWSLQGSLPPMSQEEWEKEFARYKTFPEWQQRKSMTLNDFKFIYFWEYGHRMLGRFIGIAFVVPGLYFASRRMIPKDLYPRIALLFGLGGCQGLIGWWMVRSGLENIDPNERKEIRVNPYRLATHLVMALTTYTLLVKTGFEQLMPATKLQEIAKQFPNEFLAAARKSRKFAIHNAALVGATVVTGAFVAGNDAGRAFNTWPKMGDHWIPDDLFAMEPLWKNFFENTSLVQFDHRIFAYSAATAIAAGYAQAKMKLLKGEYWKQLPRLIRFSYSASVGVVLVQVGLGISTLLMYVPVELASAHQTTAVLLLTVMTGLVHVLGFSKFGKPLVKSGASTAVSQALINSALKKTT